MKAQLKSLLPRSFFGRAVLILVVPVIVIQIVLSIVFVQRHYERVTQQMTGTVLQAVEVLIDEVNAAHDPDRSLARQPELASALGLQVQILDALPTIPENHAAWYDLAGREILSVLQARVPGYLGAVLCSEPMDSAVLWVAVEKGTLQVTIPRDHLAPTNPHQLLVIVFLASVVLVLMALQYLRLQIRPIRRLGTAAEAYGRGQSVPFRPSGAREIRAAGLAFLDMRNRIERQNSQRKLMLSGLGHDMRTPLTRMRLMVSMAGPTADSAALEAEIADLEHLLNSFLDYSRGDSHVPEGLFDPPTIVADLVARYRAAGQQVALTIAPNTPHAMHLQEGQLERALDNILSNALDYGKQARVQVFTDADALVITIEDDGPGIAPADRARAREPFVRLDSARNQDVGAHVGLGLAIADDVMRAHGGRLELADSPALGGLLVRLKLPLNRAP